MYPSKLETSVQCWASIVDRGPPLKPCGVNVPLLAGLEPYIFIQCIDLVNKKQLLNSGLLLAQSRRRWPSIKTTLYQRLVNAG